MSEPKWTIRYEQGEPVEVLRDGEEVNITSDRLVTPDDFLDLIRQARTDRDAQFLAAIEEDVKLIVRFLGKISCPDDVSDAADRLAARFSG